MSRTEVSGAGAGAAPDGVPLAELLALAERTAREAGALIHDGRPSRVEVASTKSSPTDVVTAMDTASEALILQRLAAARPQDAFLGEETGYRAGSSGLTWVVDPIDGTVNYLYGIRAYAVSVAVVVDPTSGAGRPHPASWQPLAGCVHDPAGAETWTATLGGGAHLSGTPLLPAHDVELAGALVATGFSYDAVRRAEQAAFAARLLPRVRDLRRIGSASLDLCSVAAGRVDAYYERGLKPWDFAAALLVATEAGVVVTGFAGGPAGEEGLLAARRALHPSMVAALGA